MYIFFYDNQILKFLTVKQKLFLGLLPSIFSRCHNLKRSPILRVVTYNEGKYSVWMRSSRVYNNGNSVSFIYI